jgi:hypothetical protein
MEPMDDIDEDVLQSHLSVLDAYFYLKKKRKFILHLKFSLNELIKIFASRFQLVRGSTTITR